METGDSVSERTWEGRGDSLADARMSWISGRAADDLRLTGLHWRLLVHFGRQNHRRGWLRVSQSELATAWGVTRQRVNIAVRDLVDWRYVSKRSQDETGESFCTYKVRLDDDEDDADAAPRKGGDGGGGVSPVRDTPREGGVSPVGDTGVTSRDTRVSPTKDTYNRLSPTDAEQETPRPPIAASGDRGQEGEQASGQDGPVKGRRTERALRPRGTDWARVLDGARSGQPERDLALDRLVVPVVTVRHLDAPTASAAIGAILDVAVARKLGERGLQLAAEHLVRHRKVKVKPVDFEAAMDAAQAQLRREAEEADRIARLPRVPVLSAATARFEAALTTAAPREHIDAWWRVPWAVTRIVPVGQATRIVVATPHPVAMAASFASSYAAPAARAAYGPDAVVEFVQAVPASSAPAPTGDRP